jgi:hypothetical protein
MTIKIAIYINNFVDLAVSFIRKDGGEFYEIKEEK